MAISSAVRMPIQGLPQAELDSLCIFADDCESPSSPWDRDLLKRKREKGRISFSDVTAEIAAVSGGYAIEQPVLGGGLTQEELDALSVEAPSAGSSDPSSPLDSALRQAKSRRSVGDGAAGALARASELAFESGALARASELAFESAAAAVVAAARAEVINEGLSQASLDKLSAPAADESDEEEEDSMVLRKRRQRAFLSSMVQSPPHPVHGAICSTPPQKKSPPHPVHGAICSTPPQKKALYSTPPRSKEVHGSPENKVAGCKGVHGSPENKVAGCKTGDTATRESPFKSPDLNNPFKTPDSGLQKSPDSSGMQRSPLGLMNRQF